MRSHRHLWSACLALVALTACACARAPQYHIIVRNGTVVDGTGDAPRRADIAIV